METHVITNQQDRMIEMLLRGDTIADIARSLNVARSTIYEWKKKSEIIAELESRRSQLKKTGQDKITSNLCTCIDNMMAMANQKTDQRVRFQANKFLIEMGLGKATTGSNVSNVIDEGDKKDKTANELQAELDDIKLKAVK